LGYASDVPGVDAIKVPQGFVTDLASVPRWPLVFWLMGDRAREPAVVHDWLYLSGITSQADADAVLYEAARVIGLSWWVAQGLWWGVRLGGGVTYRRYRALTVRMR
jgi:hypothetical protein